MISDEKAKQIASNPDGCTDEELKEFIVWVGDKTHPVRQAIHLFGYSHRNKPIIATTLYLKNYCHNSLIARNSRKRGHIRKAKQYENLCQAIYEQLPEFARW